MAKKGTFEKVALLKSKSVKGWEMAKKGTYEKVALLKSKSWSFNEDKKGRNNDTNRFLISVNIMGSSGPSWIVVKENDVVCDVIEAALKSHARQGRLPVLESDATHFDLYCSHAGPDALCQSEPIGSFGTRKFVLCEKQPSSTKTEARSKMMTEKGRRGWKSLSFKVRSALDYAIGGRA